jgi:hypothetical protein
MRRIFALLAVAVVAFAVTGSAAEAAPTEINVRIEGKGETLFEGPILVQSHRVKASSDKRFRHCNGLNPLDPWNAAPAPVPTSVSSDAMRIIGLSFDGRWYNNFEDYFVTRWGPDADSDLEEEWWGVVVNNAFTSVGGCQYQLDSGDEVLWIYNAFTSRDASGHPASRLLLYPGDYSGGPVQLTDVAGKGVPYEVEVDQWGGAYSESSPPNSPTRSPAPFKGAEVVPVITAANGFERIDSESPETVDTGTNGKASITFQTYGWHRLKATVVGSKGTETVVRSNRLDVCVPEPPATGCGALPVEDLTRTPPPLLSGEDESTPEETESEAAPAKPQAATQTPPTAVQGAVQVALRGLDRKQISKGIVGVSWAIRNPGAGVRKWTVSSKALGKKGARYVARASGRSKTSAQIRLPRGERYALQITFLDNLGRSSTAALGKVRVPS